MIFVRICFHFRFRVRGPLELSRGLDSGGSSSALKSHDCHHQIESQAANQPSRSQGPDRNETRHKSTGPTINIIQRDLSESAGTCRVGGVDDDPKRPLQAGCRAGKLEFKGIGDTSLWGLSLQSSPRANWRASCRRPSLAANASRRLKKAAAAAAAATKYNNNINQLIISACCRRVVVEVRPTC